MAGVGKIAKLGKTLWKGISYLPKKAHKLQGADRNLFNPNTRPTKANNIYMTCFAVPTLGMLGTTGTMIYADYTGNNELSEKMNKTTTGGLIGLVVGGPIGSLIGMGLGYFLSGSKEAAPADEESEAAEELEETEETQNEQTQKLNPADQETMNKFVESVQNLEVGQSVTFPELQDKSASIKVEVGTGLAVELKAGDKITRTEEGLKLIVGAKTNNGETETPAANASESVTPNNSTQVAPAVNPASTQEQDPKQEKTPNEVPATQTPPADNLFGGTINEITLKDYKVVKDDCLWNIAKRELKKANPGATITNAHILLQVKEFIRLNPQIKNPDLIYPDQEIKLAA